MFITPLYILFNLQLKSTIMLHLFFFTSTRKSDNCSCVTVISNNLARARKLVERKFRDYNYYGKPKRLAI